MIIIKTPQPERLVLVPLDACSEVREDDPRARLGARVGLTVRTTDARDATPADLERGGYGKLPMWVTSAADGQKLIGERDEARAAFLGCAQAIGIVCQADGHADEPGPPAAVIAAIKELAKRGEDLESELATANEWRERWCRESEAAAVQSNANWQRAKDLEARAEKAEATLAEHVRIVWAAGQKAEPVGVAMLRKLKERAEKAEATLAMHGRPTYVEAVERAEKAERERDDARTARASDGVQVDALLKRIEVERDALRTDLDAERRRADAIERANVELHEKLAQADRELDGACSPDCQARIDYVEADNAKLRVELARLTAPGEGEPTDNELRAVWDPEPTITAARRALFRAGVAHERARHGACCPLDPDMPVEAVDADLRAAGVDPEALAARGLAFVRECQRQLQGRATEDELVALYRKVYETHGGRTIDVSHDDCLRAAVAAVAAHVRKECLVAQAVGMGADVRITRSARAVAWDIDVTRRPVAPGARYVHEVKAADVPSTLARLLGEVSK